MSFSGWLVLSGAPFPLFFLSVFEIRHLFVLKTNFITVSDFGFRVEEMSKLTKKGKTFKKTLYYRNTKWKTPKKHSLFDFRLGLDPGSRPKNTGSRRSRGAGNEVHFKKSGEKRRKMGCPISEK